MRTYYDVHTEATETYLELRRLLDDWKPSNQEQFMTLMLTVNDCREELSTLLGSREQAFTVMRVIYEVVFYS